MSTVSIPNPLPDFTPSRGERRMAVAIHLVIMVLPFLIGLNQAIIGMVVTAIMVSTDPMKSEFVSGHAKQSFLFHAALLCVSLVLTMGFGILGASPFLFLIWVVYVALGAWRAQKGLDYPLPWQWRW